MPLLTMCPNGIWVIRCICGWQAGSPRIPLLVRMYTLHREGGRCMLDWDTGWGKDKVA